MPGTLGLSHRVPKRHSGGPSTQVAPHPPSPALCHAAPATAWAAGHVDGDHPVHILRAITGQCEGQTSGDHSDPGGGWEARVRNENARPHCVGAPPRHRSTPSPPDPRAPRSGTYVRRGAGGTALPALWEGGGAGHARRKRTRCRGSHARPGPCMREPQARRSEGLRSRTGPLLQALPEPRGAGRRQREARCVGRRRAGARGTGARPAPCCPLRPHPRPWADARDIPTRRPVKGAPVPGPGAATPAPR